MATPFVLSPTVIQYSPEDRAIALRAAQAAEEQAVALQQIEKHLHNLAEAEMQSSNGRPPQWR